MQAPPERDNLTKPAPESLPTRHSLLNRIKDLGDDSSWREFLEKYWELIYNLARKVGLTDSEAQDVVQETVIRVSRNIGSFQTGTEHGSFKAWLLQQTRWRIADQFRKRDKFNSTPERADSIHTHVVRADDDLGTVAENRIPDPASLELDRTWDTQWERHMLRTALERLKAASSPKQFQMFDLHALQGLSASQTAKTVGASVLAVHMATSRLRRLLRREIVRLERATEGM